MHRVRWYRRTPLRLSLIFSGLAVVTFLVAGIIAYLLISRELNDRQDMRINQIVAEFEVLLQRRGDAVLRDMVRTRASAISGGSAIIALSDIAGTFLEGNLPVDDINPGWSDVSAADLGMNSDFSYRVYDTPMGQFRLTVGLGSSDLEEVLEILLGALLWSAVFVTGATLFAGAVIAERARARMAVVQSAIGRVAEGDLGARIGLSGSRDDIDALSEGINSALSRLQATVDAMRQVSTDIAHDLRTPLNRLHMRAEAALVRARHGEMVVADIEEILSESSRIAEVFAAMLRIAQIEAGSRRDRFRPVDMASLLGEVIAIYADVAEDAGMTLKPTSIDRAMMSGDAELLTQAVVNVIENAIRHCPEGTIVSIGLRNQPEGIVLTVDDNGPGIPPQEREAVFGRLYRLEQSRTTPGTGLGLSLVKAVADLHGATVSLADARPGLSVRLTFPPAAIGQTPRPVNAV